MSGQGVLIVGEELCEELVSRADAFTAVEAVFGAMAKGDAWNFPVIREAIGHADALYGFKSGFDRAGQVLGVKSGGYWPHNLDKGLTTTSPPCSCSTPIPDSYRRWSAVIT